jgi:hypothetical protein
MGTKFSAQYCTVDELLARQALLTEMAQGKDLPALNFVAQQYRELERQRAAMCCLLMDGADAVGFLLMRKAGPEQANTAVMDVAVARPELRDEWAPELGSIAYVEGRHMAQEMGATGFRIPEQLSGPASAALNGQVASGTGTAFFEVI